MAKRLVLHAGLHKTGSTYIQQTLFLNRERLARARIDVPEALNHHPDRLREFAFSFHRADFQTAFRRLVLDSPGEAVLMSSEELSHAIRDHHLTQAFLRDLAERDGVAVRIVAYLRRQDEMRESAYQQQVRTQFRGPIEAFDGYPFDYRPTVAAFRSASDDVVLRPYEPAAWRGGDIFADLMDIAGIDVGGPLQTPDWTNKSLDRRLVLFLSATPAALKREFGSRWDGYRVLDRFDVVRPDGGRFQASPDARRAFLERFREANIELAFGDAALEDHLLSPPKDRDWVPPAPVTPRERAAAYSVLAGAGVVHRLRRGVARAAPWLGAKPGAGGEPAGGA